MGKSSFFGPETIALHSGHHPDSDYGSPRCSHLSNNLICI